MTMTVTELLIHPENFALEATLRMVDQVNLRFERTVAQSTESDTPLVWAWSPDPSGLYDHLRSDPSLADLHLLSKKDHWRLYQFTWVPAIADAIANLTDGESAVLDMQGTEDGWQLRVLFSERESLATLTTRYAERGIRVEILRIHQLRLSPESEYGLTTAQYEVLQKAFDQGYFHVPRRCTMRDIAEDLNVSQQALSERMRRALQNLIGNSLILQGRTADEAFD